MGANHLGPSLVNNPKTVKCLLTLIGSDQIILVTMSGGKINNNKKKVEVSTGCQNKQPQSILAFAASELIYSNAASSLPRRERRKGPLTTNKLAW